MLIFESSFPPNFREEEIKKILSLVSTGKSCQIICIPGGGKATIMRLLAHNRELLKYHLKESEKNHRFVYINLLELSSYSQEEVFRHIYLNLTNKNEKEPATLAKRIQEHTNQATANGKNLTLLFDHFDQYQNQLPRSFFQLIKDLSAVARYRFSCAFATRRDLAELTDPEIFKNYYELFMGNTVYIDINNQQASEILFLQIESVFNKKLTPAQKKNIINLTGHHAKLTKVLAELALREGTNLSDEDLLKSAIVNATLYEIWLFLTAQEQETLKSVARNLPTDNKEVDKLCILDLISNENNKIEFTVPLLKYFIENTLPKTNTFKITYDLTTREIKKGPNIISDLLSPQELRLLKFLIENEAKVIEREAMIHQVWPDAKQSEGVSDEAIDQMIFRLRKKIEDEPNNPKHITTVKGQGWRFTS